MHLWDALSSSDLLQTGRYRCLRCTLPGFGIRHGKTGVPALAPNFYEAAQLLVISSKAWYRRTGRARSR